MNRMKKIDDQKGIVSILISIVMMIVLTLLALGISQVGINDQQNALKRQLSTEAFYLAESGINNAINNKFTDTLTNNCSGNSTSIDSTNNSSIPCVKVDKNLISSTYQLNNSQSKVVSISDNMNRINSISFKFTGSSTVDSSCSSSDLTTIANWNCQYPLLMVSLVSGNLLNLNSSIANLYKEGTSNGIVTFYLYPYTKGSVNHTVTGINDIFYVKCDNISCNSIIDLSNILTSKQFYLRITPIYRDTAITISSYNSNDGTGDANTSSQISIDSTGKVGSTSQRIKEYITNNSNYLSLPNQSLIDQTPLFGIQTTNDLCKNIQGYDLPSETLNQDISKNVPISNGGTTQAC